MLNQESGVAGVQELQDANDQTGNSNVRRIVRAEIFSILQLLNSFFQSSSSDHADYFNGVILAESDGRKVGARDGIAIPFHQNQFIRQLQRSQEFRESDADRHLARFSVER